MGYKLAYEGIDGYKATIEFREEMFLDELKQNLRYFLLSCSWLPEQVDELLGREE